jgi:hypothetical protein
MVEYYRLSLDFCVLLNFICALSTFLSSPVAGQACLDCDDKCPVMRKAIKVSDNDTIKQYLWIFVVLASALAIRPAIANFEGDC